jgi:alkanesulfonate monooxygenase SsuD/methylene tetrahydromethanopterin reductase-like flavin-dependent oxidoreductase (luciferase family)
LTPFDQDKTAMPFPLSITFPFDHIDAPDEFVSMQAVHECARAAEEAGFASGTLTDHPVPSHRWLDGGGHYAQDPFVMLAMVAAVTTRLKLQTSWYCPIATRSSPPARSPRSTSFLAAG